MVDRSDDAFDALRGVPVSDRWDEVVARASSEVLEADDEDRGHRGRGRWLAAAAVAVIGLVGGALALAAGDEDGDRSEPLDVGGSPADPVPTPADCALTTTLDFEPFGTGRMIATTAEQTVTVETPPRSSIPKPWLLRDGGVTEFVGSNDLVIAARLEGPCPVRVQTTGLGDAANEQLALDVIAGYGPPLPIAVTDCGELRYEGTLDLRTTETDTAFDGSTDEQTITVSWPASAPAAGAETSPTLVEQQPTAVHVTRDGTVALEVSPITGSRCGTIGVVVTGGSADANREVAIRVATDLRATPSVGDGLISTNGDCAELVITSSTLPDGFSASLAADGVFEGNGQSIEVQRVIPSGRSGDAVQGWIVGERTDISVPAVEALVPGQSDCALVLIGHGGVTVPQLRAVFETAHLIFGDRRPRLRPSCATWPETSQDAVPYGLPPWRDLPDETAVAFVQEVLGWSEVVVPADQNPNVTHLGPASVAVIVTRRSNGASLDVRLERCLGARFWSVTAVGPASRDRDFAVSVSVQGTRAQATASLGAASGGTVLSTRFDYGGRVAEGPAGEPFELGFEPDTDGSVLVLARDETGEVVSAWGMPLPAGDYEVP